MANEISITAKLSVANTGGSASNATSVFSRNQAGISLHHTDPSISTTAALLVIAPVLASAEYILFIRNADSTNYVELSFNGGTTWPIRIAKGQSFGPATINPSQVVWLRANTAACICEVIAVES